MSSLIETPPESAAELVLDKPRPLVEHLEELRARLIRALLGWSAATGVAFWLYPRLLPLIIRPPVTRLVFTSPVEPFFMQMKVAMVGGIILAFPWLLYQASAFVSIALKPREKRWLFRLIPASYLLFLTGGAIGLFGAGPIGMRFLLAYATPQLVPFITLNAYVGYLTYLTLGLAVLFQLPIVLFLLATLGVLKLGTLTYYRRHVFLGILIVAAAITPGPDIFSQLLVTIPTYILYELSILAIWIRGRK